MVSHLVLNVIEYNALPILAAIVLFFLKLGNRISGGTNPYALIRPVNQIIEKEISPVWERIGLQD
jgi:hypothetical protein